jgi:hypothetical protein
MRTTTNPLHTLRRTRWIWPVTAFLIVAGCDTADEQRNFEDDANGPPSGIVRTDEGGRLVVDDTGSPVEDDRDDWRTAPAFAGVVRFDPAYPNPTTGTIVTVPVVVTEFNALPGGLILRAFNDANVFVRLDEVPEASQPGSYTLFFSPGQFVVSGDIRAARGIHRLFVFDLRGSVVTYGDILVE